MQRNSRSNLRRYLEHKSGPSLCALLCLACASGSAQTPPPAQVANTDAAQHGTAKLPPLDVAATLRELSNPDACAKRVGHTEAFERCEASAVAKRAVLVTLVTECGGDSCSAQAWLLRDAGAPHLLLGYDGGGLAFGPNADFYVTDTRLFESEDDYANLFFRAPELVSARVDSKPVPFARCMSPTLSADQQNFICRNRYADVLRVGLGGGSLKLVAVNTDPQAVTWTPYAYLYPEVVEFNYRGQMLVRWGDAAEPVTHEATPLQLPRLEQAPTVAVPPFLNSGAFTQLVNGSPEVRHLTEPFRSGVQLSPSETLIVSGPAVRLLVNAEIVHSVENGTVATEGECCDRASPRTYGDPPQCDLPLVLRDAWWLPSTRTLLTLRSVAFTTKACEGNPQWDSVTLPRTSPPLRDFPNTQ